MKKTMMITKMVMMMMMAMVMMIAMMVMTMVAMVMMMVMVAMVMMMMMVAMVMMMAMVVQGPPGALHHHRQRPAPGSQLARRSTLPHDCHDVDDQWMINENDDDGH